MEKKAFWKHLDPFKAVSQSAFSFLSCLLWITCSLLHQLCSLSMIMPQIVPQDHQPQLYSHSAFSPPAKQTIPEVFLDVSKRPFCLTAPLRHPSFSFFRFQIGIDFLLIFLQLRTDSRTASLLRCRAPAPQRTILTVLIPIMNRRSRYSGLHVHSYLLDFKIIPLRADRGSFPIPFHMH